MNQVKVSFSQIDWQLLRKQKQTLVNIIYEISKTHPPAQTKDLTGLLHLLDHIQDEAAKILGEEAVFAKNDVPVK